jgi:trehalose 6-phosphate synthase
VKLIVASNSAPRWQDGVGLLPRSPGGLVPLLADLLTDGGDWVCTAPAAGSAGGTPSSAEGPVTVTEVPGGVRLHHIWQPAPVIEQHYAAIGTRVLLWLFHYLLDTVYEPAFGSSFADAWRGYEVVNQAYAHHLATIVTQASDELLLLNDHHLFLVPEMLDRAGRRPGMLVFFHGLPWCEPDYFGILPAAIRDRILASLLRCDVVGFHCTRWARSFAKCCTRYLPGCRSADGGVHASGRLTRLVVAPFPLDTAALERLRGDAATAGWRQRITRLADGRRVIARADRIDLWKNLPRGFAAYEQLLERDPAIAREWWFCAVATAPSRPTERSVELQRRCEDMVACLNERFGSPARPAVSLVYPDLAASRNCVVAAFSAAAVTLVNPTFDGMNLVAKEALYLAERAPLLLSRNAGAFEQLAAHVTPLEPFSVTETATALAAAMADGVRSPPSSAQEQSSVQEQLRRQDATGWLGSIMGS